jgi:hypothetical protein
MRSDAMAHGLGVTHNLVGARHLAKRLLGR